jgi:hypothetical protein
MPRNKQKQATVNEMIRAGLKAGLPNAEIFARVKKAHPYSTLSLPTVNYYRNQLRGLDRSIPTEKQARSR